MHYMALYTEMSKRKLWTDESMEAAVQCLRDGSKRLRETARLYNIPVETLQLENVEVDQDHPQY